MTEHDDKLVSPEALEPTEAEGAEFPLNEALQTAEAAAAEEAAVCAASDPGSEPAASNEEPHAIPVVDVRFKSSGKVYFFDPGQLTIPDETDVIIETARGPEFGFCIQGNHTVPVKDVSLPLRPVLRIATDHDRRMLAEYRAREPEALRICEEKISKHKLDMKLVSAEYAFDGSKILFFFTSDGRVDFRDLVKDLASVFRTRIELRQIGVRDEAKMLGGLGICGRPFCCKQFLDDFQPVSIKMAKTQSLSLNPTKISGTCGRLMCCLKYEQDAYEYLQKESPKAESLVDTPEGRGTIEDIVLLRRQAKVRLQAYPDTVKLVSWDDLTILRSGKPRKEDLEAEAAEAAAAQAAAQAAKASYPRLTGLDDKQSSSDRQQHSSSAQRSRSPRTEGNSQTGQGNRSDRTESGSRSGQKPRSQGKGSFNKAKPQNGKPLSRSADRTEAQASPAGSGTESTEHRNNSGYHRRNYNNRRSPRKNGSSGGGEGANS